MNPVPDLLRRQQATSATLAKFRAKAWSWADGITCAHLARFHLRQMGHKPESLPRLRSLIAARRALDLRGWADVIAMLDAQPGLLRIAPAEMAMGDLAALPSDNGNIGAVMVCAGPHKLLGWREDVPELVVLDVEFGELAAAWRV